MSKPKLLLALGRYCRWQMLSSSIEGAMSTPSDAIRQQKREVRTAIRRRLREFLPIDRQSEDLAIQDRVLRAEWFKNSKRLCAYVSCPALREVDTSKILEHILNSQQPAKKLYVPRVKDKQSHMQMLHVTSYKDLVANEMSILEPSLTDESGNARADVMDTDEPVDLLLLPGLGFDTSGRRLGRGGGYYDVFLHNLLQLSKKNGWKRPLLVALAYSPQIVEEGVPVDDSDVSIDALVCASGTLQISSYAAQLK